MKSSEGMAEIGFGGGCHWCSEAVFQSLKGVSKVDQGFIVASGEYSSFSEGVVVHYDPNTIQLQILVEIHLRTHKSTVNHWMRPKYRSAIYAFSELQLEKTTVILHALQNKFGEKLITKVLRFHKFRPSQNQFINYYYNNPGRPFCEKHIDPKLKILLKQFPDKVNKIKVNI